MSVRATPPLTQSQRKASEEATQGKLDAAENTLETIKGKHETVGQAIDARIATLKDGLAKIHGTKTRRGYLQEFNESGGQTWNGMTVDSRGPMGKYEDILTPLLKDAEAIKNDVIPAQGYATLQFTSPEKTGGYTFDVIGMNEKITDAVQEWMNSAVKHVEEKDVKLPVTARNHHDFHQATGKLDIEDLSTTFTAPTADSLQVLREAVTSKPSTPTGMKPRG